MSFNVALEQVDDVGRTIAQALRIGDVVGLSGDLGAGKTTLARAILRGLGLEGEAPSPSFAIVQPYDADELTVPVLHVDLYRLDSPEECSELGLGEARHDHALLVEWPERMGDLAPPDMLLVMIAADGESARRLTVEVPPAWEGRWLLPQ